MTNEEAARAIVSFISVKSGEIRVDGDGIAAFLDRRDAELRSALAACREELELNRQLARDLIEQVARGIKALEDCQKKRDEDLVKARAMLTAMRGIVGKRLGHSAYCVTVECTCPPEDVAFFNALGAAESAAREGIPDA